jgi:hypothetical protein
MKALKIVSLLAFAMIVLDSCSGTKGSRCNECPKFSKVVLLDKKNPS